MIDSAIDDEPMHEAKKRFGVTWKVSEVPIEQHFAYNQMFKYEVKYRQDGGTKTEENQLPTKKRC